MKSRPIHGGDAYGLEVAEDFSTSVSPLDVPDAIRRAILASTRRLDRYPDYRQRAFRRAVAEVEGCAMGEVLGGAGVSELLVAIARSVAPQRALLFAPSFYGYRHALYGLGAAVEIVDATLRPDVGFALDDASLDALDDHIDLVILANPNNPTGRAVAPKLMERLLQRASTVGAKLLVDESFLRFSTVGESVKGRIRDYAGLYVVDSFSKLFAIPAVRSGYVVSAADNIDRLRRFVPEWNLSAIAEAASLAALELVAADQEGAEGEVRRVRHASTTGREELTKGLRALGVEVFDSDANFILFKSVVGLDEELLRRDRILIRNCSNFVGLGDGFYRIATRSSASNARLLRAVGAILAESRGRGEA